MPHPPPSRARLPLMLGGIGLVLLLVGWPLAWWIATREATRALVAWTAEEAALGRDWSCASTGLGGFPFRIVFTCDAPALAATLDGKPFTAHAAALSASARADAPYHLAIDVRGPVAFSSDAGATGTLGWAMLTAHLRGPPGAPERFEVEVVGPTLAASGAGGPIDGRADRLDLHFRASLQHVAADHAIDVAGTLAGATSPQLARSLGDPAPLGLTLTATATRVAQGAAGDAVTWIDAWRRDGGTLEIESLRAGLGTATLAGAGTLHLDDAHRLAGTLDVALAGADPLLRHFGVEPGLLKVGALLSGLIGSKPAGTSVGMGRLALSLADGRVALGPVRGPVVLAPLY